MVDINNSDQMNPVTKSENSENGKGLSLRGLIEVFSKPGKFFEDLKNHPKILIPYIALLILSLISMYFMFDVILKSQLESPQLQERLQGQPLPETAKQLMSVSIFLIGIFASLLIPLILALVAIFFGNFVMAGKVRFKQVLSVMLYGQILFEVGGVIAGLLIFLKGKMMTPFSLGFLALNQGMESLSFTALSKIDIFNIWEIIVVGIGLAAIYGFDRNKGYWLSVLSIGLVAVLHIAMVALGGLFR